MKIRLADRRWWFGLAVVKPGFQDPKKNLCINKMLFFIFRSRFLHYLETTNYNLFFGKDKSNEKLKNVCSQNGKGRLKMSFKFCWMVFLEGGRKYV